MNVFDIKKLKKKTLMSSYFYFPNGNVKRLFNNYTIKKTTFFENYNLTLYLKEKNELT